MTVYPRCRPRPLCSTRTFQLAANFDSATNHPPSQHLLLPPHSDAHLPSPPSSQAVMASPLSATTKKTNGSDSHAPPPHASGAEPNQHLPRQLKLEHQSSPTNGQSNPAAPVSSLSAENTHSEQGQDRQERDERSNEPSSKASYLYPSQPSPPSSDHAGPDGYPLKEDSGESEVGGDQSDAESVSNKHSSQPPQQQGQQQASPAPSRSQRVFQACEHCKRRKQRVSLSFPFNFLAPCFLLLRLAPVVRVYFISYSSADLLLCFP